MIDYLTHTSFIDYDESLLPSRQLPGVTGGGMSTKTARVLEVLHKNYPQAKAVGNTCDISPDSAVVLVEPLRFTMEIAGNDESIEEVLRALENASYRKILYCSEKSMVRMAPGLSRRLFDACDIVTANCTFQEGLLRYLPWCPPTYRLCDPVPDDFVFEGADVKRKRVIASGHIDWHKNVERLIEIYKNLNGEMERVYVGSHNLWTNTETTKVKERLQSELYKHCDTIVEDANRFTLSKLYRESLLAVWIAMHDTFSFGLHEMMRCGVLVSAANHGLAAEVPVYVGHKASDQVERLKELASIKPDELERVGTKIAKIAATRCSYETFQKQFESILYKLYWT